MKKRILTLLCLITFLLPTFSSARENATGIWIGTMTSPIPPHETAEIYISIHETEELTVVIFLSAVEETGDLLSSTFIGSSIGTINNTLESYGETAYFPVTYDVESKKVIYGEHDSIWMILYDDGTGIGAVASNYIAFPYPVQLRKIVGTK